MPGLRPWERVGESAPGCRNWPVSLLKWRHERLADGARAGRFVHRAGVEGNRQCAARLRPRGGFHFVWPMKLRFQFRLRTLMIAVTLLSIPCAYLGWQAAIVRHRAWVLNNYNGSRKPPAVIPVDHWARQESLPWIRRVLGDHT